MEKESFEVQFKTNIDAYSHRPFPHKLPFRPQLGDRVPFIQQWKLFPSAPVLTITNIEYDYDIYGNFDEFVCYLDFDKNTHPEIRRSILNHENKYL